MPALFFNVMTRSYQGKVTRGVIRTVPVALNVTPGLRAKPQRNVPVSVDHTP
jgi:hypothetical protein